MVRTLATRSATGALAALMATAGLIAPAHAAPPLSVDKAGTLVGWGTETSPPAARTLPDDLKGTAFSKIVATSGVTVALTSAGKVVVLGESEIPGADLREVPDSLAGATVTDIAVASNSAWAAAVTSDGALEVWGMELDSLDPTDVPPGLSGVKSVAISQSAAAAVKTDGTVVAWGRDQAGETAVPDGLTGVTSLSGGDFHYYAMKNDGTVVAWGFNGNDQTTLPAALSVPGNVDDIKARARGGLALLHDGSLVSWGHFTDPGVDNSVPASLAGKNVVSIDVSANNNVAVADDGTITAWGLSLEPGLTEPPAELATADVSAVAIGGNHAIALVTKVLEVTKSAVSGTAAINQTLTGTPATFSGAPDSLATQWLADGVAIAGATGTTLAVTPALAGKRITFATTANKAGSEPFVSTSVPTAAVPALPGKPQPPATPAKSKPTFKVSKAPTSKKKGKATVTVRTVSGKPKATGKATVTIKQGKTTKKIKVTLSGGKKSISLPKLKKGTWKVQVSYSGDKNYRPLKSSSYKLKVKK